MTINKLPERGAVLTEIERWVVSGMSYGKSNKDIGKDLHIVEDTVKTHARRLFRKLGARDRAHAVRLALEAGYLQPDVIRPDEGDGKPPVPKGQSRGPVRQQPHMAACWTGGGCQCPTRRAVA